MKPNFEEMSRGELKAYVLQNRHDIEAIRFLFRTPPGVEVKRYPPVCTPEGVPIEENIRIAEEAIRQRVEQNKEKQQEKELYKEKELEAKLRQKIEQEVEEKLRQKIEQEVEEKLRRKIEQEKDQIG